MKSTKTFTIDHDIYMAARATGANLSAIVEEALANHVNWAGDMTPIYNTFDVKEDEANRFFNDMVHAVIRRGYPGVSNGWAKKVKNKFNLSIAPYELYKFIMELVEDG